MVTNLKIDVETIQKEESLIEEIAELVTREMQADRTLPYDEAFKRVIDKNPQISKEIEEIEIELIKKKLTDSRDIHQRSLHQARKYADEITNG